MKFQNITTIVINIVVILAIFLTAIEISAQLTKPINSPFISCWTFKTQELTTISGASDNKLNIYFPLLGGKIISISSRDGAMNWESILGGEIILEPIIENNSIYVANAINKRIFIRSLSLDLGITKWQSKLDVADEIYLLNATNSLLVISKNGHISALDFETGELLWNKEINVELSSTPIVFENQILIGTKDKKILVLSTRNGGFMLKKDISAAPSIISKISRDNLFWGDNNGNAYLMNLSINKILWKIRAGAGISDVQVTSSDILLASTDNFIYKALLENGKLIWKRRFDGRPTLIPYSINGFILVFTSSSGLFNMIDIEDGKIINQGLIDESYFLNKPLIIENSIIVSTAKGLNSLTNSTKPCLKQ